MSRVDIKSGGATGNGTTDDTANIQTVIDALGALYLSTGRRQYLYVGAGRYLISRNASQTYCLLGKSGIDLAGPGTFAMAASQVPQVVMLSAQNTLRFHVEGCTFDGNSSNQGAPEGDPKNHAIYTRSAKYARYTGVTCINVDGDAFYCGSDADGVDIVDFNVDTVRRSIVTVTAGAKNVRVHGINRGKNWSGDQSAALNVESDTTISTGISFEGVKLEPPAPESAHTCLSLGSSGCDGLIVRDCEFPTGSLITTTDNVLWDRVRATNRGTFISGSTCLMVRLACVGVRIRRSEFNVWHGDGGGNDGFHDAALSVQNTNANVPRDVTIEDCRFNTHEAMYAMHLINLQGVTNVRRNRVEAGATGRGILAEVPNTTTYFEDLRVNNNTFVDCANSDAHLSLYSVANGAGNGFRAVDLAGNTYIDKKPTANTYALRVQNLGTSPFPLPKVTTDLTDARITNDISGFNQWVKRGNVAGTVKGEYEGYGVPTMAALKNSHFYRRDTARTYLKSSDAGAWVLT